jgi:putative ABC transport system permease protein
MLLNHLSYALRQLRRSPGFAMTAVLTLAIAIGGVTAVFSIVQAILLRPLPFHEPDRLASLHEGIEHEGEYGFPSENGHLSTLSLL